MSNFITCINEDNDDNILIGTPNGLFSISKHNFILNFIGLHQQKIESILTDSKKKTWVGVNGKIYLLNNKNGKVTPDSIHFYKCQTTSKPKPIDKIFESY